MDVVLRHTETRINSGANSNALQAIGMVAILLVLLAIYLFASGSQGSTINGYPG